MQGSKDSRSTTSCSECQRRKQKCSREWPCNHCQARKVPHLCQFSQKRLQQDSQSNSTSESRGQKRSLEGSNDEPPLSREDSREEVEDGLKAWGYMPGHVHYMLKQADSEPPRPGTLDSEQSSEVEKVLHAIPPRSITDAFVNHFLSVVNYRYNAIYGPTFTENYVQWWSDRASGKRLSPEFTCLLLRILAYSVQYLTAPLRKMIEFELACTSQTLTERFGDAAEQLSSSFPASRTSLERVQEQFLKGAWLKSESKIVESWHALGSTIREAQELGIDKDKGIEGLSEFEIEIRRRLWTLLYIWDWQMSAWLGRPHLIDQKDCTFAFPNLRLDESSSGSLLSPFAHMALQAMLARRISQHMGDIQVIGDLTASQVIAVENECEAFIDDLPPIFRLEAPDTSLDEQHPYFIFQRCQLHVVIYMTQLDFLKPYLTRSPHDRIGDHDNEFRTMGIDLSLKLLRVARTLFDHEFPINAKFHLVVFCIFDTATILCSAIIHDVDNDLPHREQVMDQIESALEMLHQLSETTKIGASSYNFLIKLVQASPVLSRHAPIRKRQRVDATSASAPGSATPSAEQITDRAVPFTDTIAKSAFTAMEPLPLIPVSESGPALNPVPQESTTDDLKFDLDQFLQENPFGSNAQLDMGGLEQIWDWENLNLDAFLNQDPPTSQG